MSNGFAAPAPRNQSSSQSKGLQPAIDAESVQQQWLSQFESLQDPRGLQGQKHAFLSIVLIAILATIGGAEGWENIELYGEAHQAWLETFLDLENGVPRADTYRRVFARINPEALQQCFLMWVNQVVTATCAPVVPIDGKSVKGSYDRNRQQSALHLVSAWASEHRLLLGQVKVQIKAIRLRRFPPCWRCFLIPVASLPLMQWGPKLRLPTYRFLMKAEIHELYCVVS